jgi:hypothetical protein
MFSLGGVARQLLRNTGSFMLRTVHNQPKLNDPDAGDKGGLVLSLAAGNGVQIAAGPACGRPEGHCVRAAPKRMSR